MRDYYRRHYATIAKIATGMTVILLGWMYHHS